MYYARINLVNATADIFMLAEVLWYWVETPSLTLEEVDRFWMRAKNLDIPDLK